MPTSTPLSSLADVYCCDTDTDTDTPRFQINGIAAAAPFWIDGRRMSKTKSIQVQSAGLQTLLPWIDSTVISQHEPERSRTRPIETMYTVEQHIL